MTEPVVIAEISTSKPTEVPVWTDVSSRLRRATTKRGKERQQDRSTAGTATFTFSNADRYFDPLYASSPLYPNLKPMRRIRLRATWDAVTYPIFDGYLDSIVQEYAGPNESVAVISATDGFKRLESAFLASVWEITAGATTAKAWYRLDEPTNEAITSTVLDRSGNGYHAIKVNNVDSTAGLLADDDNAAAAFPDTLDSGIAMPESVTPTTLPWAVEFWMRSPAYSGPTNSYTDIIYPFASGGAGVGALGEPYTLNLYTRTITDGINVGKLAVLVGPSAAPQCFVRTSVQVFDDAIHHVVIVAESATPLAVYVDGVDVSEGALNNSTVMLAHQWALGLGSTELVVDELRVYEGTVPDAATIAAHYAAGSDPWANDTPAERIERVLDLIGWPAADRDLSATGSELQATSLGGTALDHLLLIEQTDLGHAFITSDGKVKWVGRRDFLVEPYITSHHTYGDDVGELGYVEMSGYSLSDDTVANIIRRQREGGTEVVAQDADSIDEYGPKTESTSGTQEADDDLAYDLAFFRLAHTKDPASHVDRLRISPRGDPDLFANVLDCELDHRITLIRRPQGVGSAITQETIVAGMSHDIGPKHWMTDLYLDPTAAQRYFLFDDTTWGESDWRFAA